MSNNLSKSFSRSLSFSVLWFLPPSSISSCLTPPAPPPPPPPLQLSSASSGSSRRCMSQLCDTDMEERRSVYITLSSETRLRTNTLNEGLSPGYSICTVKIYKLTSIFITVPLKRCEKTASYKKADLLPYVMNRM